MQNFKDINYKNFALNRFHLADYRPYDDFSILNYVECLEYLFVPDSSGGEIKYKFSSRGTLILAGNELPLKREDIYTKLRKIYDLRSAIVHGNRLKEEAKLEDYLKDLKDFCRKAIQFYFRHQCLDNRNKRRKLMEKIMIYECKVNPVVD
jgi:hypothetical protein